MGGGRDFSRVTSVREEENVKNCLIDPRELLKFDFGPMHPFKIYRLGLAYALMEAYGLTELESVYILNPREATLEEAKTFHTDGYLEVLRLADSGMWLSLIHI